MLDISRLQDLQSRMRRIIAIGTVLLITVSNVGTDLQSIANFKQTIKEHTAIILQPMKTEK